MAGDNRAIDEQATIDSVVAGPLCESGDVFTQLEGGKVETRAIPAAKVGGLSGVSRHRRLRRIDVLKLQQPPTDS
ncbi:hypothetical protein WDV93_24310 [Pantoea ananatis]